MSRERSKPALCLCVCVCVCVFLFMPEKPVCMHTCVTYITCTPRKHAGCMQSRDTKNEKNPFVISFSKTVQMTGSGKKLFYY